jgi:hypothetical protein
VTTVDCTRCGVQLQFTGRPPGADARLLRRSAIPEGHCAACAMTNWLQNSDAGHSPLRTIIERRGPAILLDRQVIAQMARVLQAGCADADPGEIDWVSVVINWELPFGPPPARASHRPDPDDQPRLF